MEQYITVLRGYMDKHGLNQSELAVKLDADRHQMSRWMNEVKEPTLETRKKWSERLGIPLMRLL